MKCKKIWIPCQDDEPHDKHEQKNRQLELWKELHTSAATLSRTTQDTAGVDNRPFWATQTRLTPFAADILMMICQEWIKCMYHTVNNNDLKIWSHCSQNNMQFSSKTQQAVKHDMTNPRSLMKIQQFNWIIMQYEISTPHLIFQIFTRS